MLGQIEIKNRSGFTIIEVMLVLAVAGLILLIVFLAVPALQRASRNHQRKTDAGRLVAAGTQVVQNHAGQISGCTSFADDLVLSETGALSYYPFKPGSHTNFDANIYGNRRCKPAASVTDTEQVDVTYDATCNGVNLQPATQQIAVRFALESGSGVPVPQCVSE